MQSIIDRPELAEAGSARMHWFREQMPLISLLKARFQEERPFRGLNVAICLHVEPKTAYWIEAILAGGAKHVYLVGCLGTTKADTAAFLAADPRIVELVPPSSFIPHPKVTSAVVTMQLYEEPPVKAQDEALFDAITRAAFEQRRKTLVNALSSSQAVPFQKEQVKDALEQLGLSASVRGEKLSIADFVSLSDTLSALRKEA